MPLMMGDWIMGTRTMSARVKGVYIGLLIHQYDHGFLPADLETISLIEPEVREVWVFLKDKFQEVSPGHLQNKKLEEVRAFWNKQAKNGQKGGRPQKEKPKQNPNINPNKNPNHNHHNDLDTDIELKLKGAFDEIYLEQQKMKWPHIDFDFQFRAFCEKVRGSPTHYQDHDTGGIRLAFQAQLRTAKSNNNGTGGQKQDKRTSETISRREAFARRYGSSDSNGQL